jgi:hypothetical protein
MLVRQFLSVEQYNVEQDDGERMRRLTTDQLLIVLLYLRRLCRQKTLDVLNLCLRFKLRFWRGYL